jgi:hypothetical protein
MPVAPSLVIAAGRIHNSTMDLNRPTTRKWLLAAATILAVLTMIVVVYQSTKPPATPQMDPQFSRSKLTEQSRGQRGNRESDAGSHGDSKAKN